MGVNQVLLHSFLKWEKTVQLIMIKPVRAGKYSCFIIIFKSLSSVQEIMARSIWKEAALERQEKLGEAAENL